MSRSNGSNMNTGGRPAPRSPSADPNAQWGHPNQGQHHGQYARQPAPQADLSSYQQPYRGQQEHANPNDPYGQLAGYRLPNQPQHDPYAAAAQPAHYQQQGYAQPHAHQPDPYAAHQGYAQQAQPQYASNGYQNGYIAEPGPSPLTPGYGQPAAHTAAPHGADPFQSLRGPSYEQWSGQGADPRAAYGHNGFASAPQPASSDWGASGATTYAGDSSFDLTGYGGPHGGLEPALGNGNYQQQNAVTAQYQEEDGEYEAEEPPRRGRATMIIAALVAAIGIGGGLAYGYKELLGSPDAGTPPVVKSATGPSKVKPTNPGGKQFAHSDSKIMDRLGDDGKSADDSGSRKVATLTIGRDGVIVPPAAPPETTSSATPTVAVPGLMVVDAFGSRSSAQAAPPPAAERPIVVNPPAAAEKPVVIAKASPPPATDKPQVASRADASGMDSVRAAVETVAPVRKKAPVTVPERTETAAVATPPPPSSSGTSGYVAVLASVPASGKSRMDALKQFADMQQKYGTLLQNKTPDVQEANLGEKGTYHRLLVGPPASRDQASSLCSGLKAAGYNDCWVTAY